MNAYIKRIRNFFKTFFLWEILLGLKLTGRYLFKEKVTLKYPEESTPCSFRFRGLHALMRYPNGEERCIACKLCETVCPALAISIEAAPRVDGSRRTTKYEIDLFKCIFCGFCEESCPVGAIVETSIMDYHFEDRIDRIMTKDVLLKIGERYENKIQASKQEDAPYR